LKPEGTPQSKKGTKTPFRSRSCYELLGCGHEGRQGSKRGYGSPDHDYLLKLRRKPRKIEAIEDSYAKEKKRHFGKKLDRRKHLGPGGRRTFGGTITRGKSKFLEKKRLWEPLEMKNTSQKRRVPSHSRNQRKIPIRRKIRERGEKFNWDIRTEKAKKTQDEIKASWTKDEKIQEGIGRMDRKASRRKRERQG